jgi:hypothetical protein
MVAYIAELSYLDFFFFLFFIVFLFGMFFPINLIFVGFFRFLSVVRSHLRMVWKKDLVHSKSLNLIEEPPTIFIPLTVTSA